jgi:hypothetical protein
MDEDKGKPGVPDGGDVELVPADAEEFRAAIEEMMKARAISFRRTMAFRRSLREFNSAQSDQYEAIVALVGMAKERGGDANSLIEAIEKTHVLHAKHRNAICHIFDGLTKNEWLGGPMGSRYFPDDEEGPSLRRIGARRLRIVRNGAPKGTKQR